MDEPVNKDVAACRSEWLVVLSEIATESNPEMVAFHHSDPNFVARREQELRQQFGSLVFEEARAQASEHFFNNGRWK
jgi:hypothetical protein